MAIFINPPQDPVASTKHKRRSEPKRSGTAVIGLGRLGRALALELARLEHDVLGIDTDESVIERLTGKLTHVVVADSTNDEALRQLDIPNYETVIVTINTGIAESVLTVSHLLAFGIPNIWVRASNTHHGRVLKQLGVQRVFYPEHDMGERIAHLVRGNLLDYIEFEDDFALVKLTAPEKFTGRTIQDVNDSLPSGVVIVAIRKEADLFGQAPPDHIMTSTDVVVAAGPPLLLEKMSEQR